MNKAIKRNILMSSFNYDKEKVYWANKLPPEIFELDLFHNFKFACHDGEERAVVNRQFPAKLAAGLIKLSKDSDLSLYIVLLTGVKVLLQRYTDQGEILTYSPLYNKNITGRTLNQLVPLFDIISEEDSFKQTLLKVRETVLQGYQHQDYPVEEIVKSVNLHSEQCQSGLRCLLTNIHDGDELADSEKGIEFRFQRVEGNLELILSYPVKSYSAELMEQMVCHLIKILELALENFEITSDNLDLLSRDEREKLLSGFNNTRADFRSDQTIHRIFEEQVEKHPDQVAVIFQDQRLTYRELNERANQLARMLRQKGLKPDAVVGIMVYRSLEMLVGIMGILKAGGAYLPIDPDYPQARIEYMLKDSSTNILLTQNFLKDRSSFAGEIIDLNDQRLYTSDASNLEYINQPTDLAYIIYTSGSTGQPKGTMIEHRSVINRLNWMQKKYPITVNDTILQKTPVTFDVSVWELFWWAIEGAKVCLLEPGGEKDPGQIVETVEREQVTTLHFVPSMLNVFLEYLEAVPNVKRLQSLRQVFASGEALKVSQVEKFNQYLHAPLNTRLYNLYGPTEATVDVTYFDCPTGGEFERIPIGRPIDNIEIYILDQRGRLQPIGVQGELCIGGVGLAGLSK